MESIRIPDGDNVMALAELDKQKHLLIKKIIDLFNALPETYDPTTENDSDNKIFLKKEIYKYDNGKPIKFPYRIHSSFSLIKKQENYILKYIIANPVDLKLITQTENNTRFGLISSLVKMKTVNNYLFSKDVINQVLKLASDFTHIPTNVQVFQIGRLNEDYPVTILSIRSIFQFIQYLTDETLIKLNNRDENCKVISFLNNIDTAVFEYIIKTKDIFEKWESTNVAHFVEIYHRGILFIPNPHNPSLNNNIFTSYGTPLCHIMCIKNRYMKIITYYVLVRCNQTKQMNMIEHHTYIVNNTLHIFTSPITHPRELWLFIDGILE